MSIKRLILTEAQKRREKGLCYYCDERYSRSHKCKSLPQLLLMEDDREATEVEAMDGDKDTALAKEFQIQEV